MLHPVSVCVPVNHKVTLSVRAESTGILNYQWFTDDEKVVYEVCDTHAFGKTLVIVCYNVEIMAPVYEDRVFLCLPMPLP